MEIRQRERKDQLNANLERVLFPKATRRLQRRYLDVAIVEQLSNVRMNGVLQFVVTEISGWVNVFGDVVLPVVDGPGGL